MFGDPVLVAGAQVLSPLKKLLDDGLPEADNDATIVHDAVIGPPVKLIKVELDVATSVTVPDPELAFTKPTKLPIVKL